MARPLTPDERRQHLSGFVGREDVIAEIDHQLNLGTSWILVRGAPGMGKTALLTAYLERLETQGIVGALDQPLSLFRKTKGPSPSDRPIVQLAPRLFTRKQGNRRLVPNTFSVAQRQNERGRRRRSIAGYVVPFAPFASRRASRAYCAHHHRFTRGACRLSVVP